MAAHQALPSLGFSRQEHWSGLPFPSPVHESEVKVKSLRHVRLFATPWTAAYQAPPPSMGFSRQEYWSGLPLPSPSTVQEGSLFSIPFSSFVVDDGHSDWCEVIPYLHFDLHLSNNEWCWKSFHVLVGCREPAYEIPSMTRSWEDLTSKADQDCRDFKKLPRCSP